LNVEFKKLPKFQNYYYPPIYDFNKNSGKVQTVMYIKSNIEYSRSKFITSDQETYFAVSAQIKITKENIYDIASVYYPNGPKGDNSDWIKNTLFKENKYIILGDFNAHAPFWDRLCTQVSSNRFFNNILLIPT
jgi:hypothetical protein